MGWKLIGKPETKQITKALAREFAEMEPTPHERPLSERRLMVYDRIYNDDGFRPVTWVKAYCPETEEIYRINGQHTSVLFSGKEDLKTLFAVIEKYECQTLEDVARLYATYDNRLMVRSQGDINASFAAVVPEFSAVSRRVINLAVGAIGYVRWGPGNGKQPAERAELMLDHVDYIVWLDSMMRSGLPGNKDANVKHIKRQAVMAAMFLTYQKAKAPATEFWAAVRDETGVKPTLPDRMIARYLRITGVCHGQGTRRTVTAPYREIYVKCIHAWNAWRQGTTTDLKYFAAAKVPSVK